MYFSNSCFAIYMIGIFVCTIYVIRIFVFTIHTIDIFVFNICIYCLHKYIYGNGQCICCLPVSSRMASTFQDIFPTRSVIIWLIWTPILQTQSICGLSPRSSENMSDYMSYLSKILKYSLNARLFQNLDMGEK